MNPFQPTAPQKTVTLTATDFTPGSQLVGIMSPIAFYDVPLGHILGLYGRKPFRAYIKGVKQFPNQAGGAAAALNLGALPVRTVRPAGTFPTTNHPDITVYGRAAGSAAAWVRLSVSAVNFATGVVTVAAQAAAMDMKAYYILPDGELEIRAARPVGSDGVTTKLFGSPFRALHEVDQTNARSAPQFGSRDIYSLPQNYRITIEARTSAVIDWSADAGHELVITAADQAVSVTDEQSLMVRAEEKLRGGF
jgi:predicted deacetylase